MKAIIGKKLGMTQIFSEDGTKEAVTVIDVSGIRVSKHIKAGDVVTHVELGAGKRKRTTQADVGNYATLGFVPQVKMTIKAEGTDTLPEIGTDIGADVFEAGEMVDVISTNKGKGFQGVVKRWGFKGGKETHGQSDRVRAPGSIGSGQTFQRIMKGVKMGGHMGNVRQTVQNIKVIKADTENGVILLRGAIPGIKGSYLLIQQSLKSKRKQKQA